MFTTYFIANLKEYSIDYIICQRKSGNLPPCVTLSHICYHLVLKSKPNNQITLHEKELWLLTGASKKSGTRMKHKYLKESKKKMLNGKLKLTLTAALTRISPHATQPC